MRQLLLFVRARLQFALRQELRAETCREFSSFEFVLRLRITSLKPQTIRFHMPEDVWKKRPGSVARAREKKQHPGPTESKSHNQDLPKIPSARFAQHYSSPQGGLNITSDLIQVRKVVTGYHWQHHAQGLRAALIVQAVALQIRR